MEFGLSTSRGNNTTNISTFEGLNRTAKGAANEFVDMLNMSASEYPCLSVCKGRSKIAEAQNGIRAVASPDITNVDEVTGITGICDGGFYYNGVLKSAKYTFDMEWDWQIEQKGSLYIINGYDCNNKKSLIYYYNVDTDEFAEGGRIMHNLILSGYNNYLCTPYYDDYGIYEYTMTKPDGTVVRNADFFNTYRDYTATDSYYSTTMNSSKNVFQGFFEVGDEITIEGFPPANNGGQIWNIQSQGVFPQPGITAERNNTIDTDEMISTDSLRSIDICRAVVSGFGIQTSAGGRASHIIYFSLYNKDGETTTFKDMTSGGYYCSGVTLKKKTRMLDNITVHQGRIWGSTPSGNQMYASSSDDIFSFSSKDIVNKYGARIPSDAPGTFTALCSYNDELLAFKSDSITVIYGTNPNNYNSYVINGVGCIAPKSVVVTPDGVIFLSYNGFYIYNGAMPRCISDTLNTVYKSAVSGYDGTSYYASAVRTDGDCELLVYNMKYGLWNKEDSLKAIGFFRYKNDFFVADKLALFKTNAENSGEWSFTFNRTYDDSFENKGINEIWVRADVSENTEFWIETSVDGGEFVPHTVFRSSGFKVYRTPVRLNVKETYQVKICGHGKFLLYDIEIHRPEGGRRYKEG